MSAPHADQLIDGYLARVGAACADLPKSACEELLSDIRSHIVEARARQSGETDATILNILDRLGDPTVVVAEARERLGLSPDAIYRTGWIEIAAVVLLPFIWVVGVVLLWWSPAWKLRDKIVGTVCSLGGYPSVLVIGLLAAHTSAGLTTLNTSLWDVLGHVLEIAVPIGLLLLPAATSVYLVLRLRSSSVTGRRRLAI